MGSAGAPPAGTKGGARIMTAGRGGFMLRSGAQPGRPCLALAKMPPRRRFANPSHASANSPRSSPNWCGHASPTARAIVSAASPASTSSSMSAFTSVK